MGSSEDYLQQQVTVLTELLTNYGHIDRLWWDNYAIGCCQPVTHEGFFCDGGGVGPRNLTESTCPHWNEMIATVRRLSPNTAIVPGPDGCLVNAETQGGTYPVVTTGPSTGGSYWCEGGLDPGDGATFVVPESDFTFVSDNDWFWNTGLATHHMTAGLLWQQFMLKYMQGANLILNIPPNSSGMIPEEYFSTIREFKDIRLATYRTPAATLLAPIKAPCQGLSFTVDIVPIGAAFDHTVTTEGLELGQSITGYSIEVKHGGEWKRLSLAASGHGATVASRVVDWGFGTISGAEALRWNCTSSVADEVTVSSFAAFYSNKVPAGTNVFSMWV